ncbi:superoxide dismutase [Candidatus Cardinium hertigii]|jgi:Fe-Mn family superoxide dismutase|uniref:Superoxide dismutase n=1 Tax=Candidatus Cardinium hertigii TaxID=247481 RepID=A0A3N2QDE4_9BACT|nr:superoxide dismutase [Candidatus Cardinium hertigii]ROT47817.1 superoxide dismutase [Candidatus Cardinium hertigii]
MIFTIPSLPYAYNALEPYIDARTMELHHTKHHQTYVDTLNQAITGTAIAAAEGAETLILERLLRSISSYSAVVQNNAGGHFNHLFFWDSLTPHTAQRPGEVLLQAIEKGFGSLEAFKRIFSTTAVMRFGSGWAWLSVAKQDGSLIISSTANQDNPLMDHIPLAEQGIPILGLDVWEHAYYLLYQNRRIAYIEAFWKLIHWEIVENRLIEATKYR